MTAPKQPHRTYQKMSREGWGRSIPSQEFPGFESLQIGALLRIAEAMEDCAVSLSGLRRMAATIAEVISRPPPVVETAEAKKAKRVAESKARATAVWLKSSGQAGGTVASQGEYDSARLRLSLRARKVLHRMGLDTLDKLAATTKEEVLQQKNCGLTTALEIEKMLGEFGLTFSDEAAE